MFRAHIMSDLHLELHGDFGAAFLASLICPAPPDFDQRLVAFFESLDHEVQGAGTAGKPIADEKFFDEKQWTAKEQGEAECLLAIFCSARREDVQALILAGDIVGFGQSKAEGNPGAYRIAEWQMRFLCCLYQQVFYVAGNHEFWEFTIADGEKLLDRLVTPRSSNFAIQNLTVLKPGRIVNFGDHQLLGGTMWFSAKIMAGLKNDWKDSRLIADLETAASQHNEHFRNFLSDSLPRRSRPIVVSHYVPSVSLISAPKRADTLSPYYYTEMQAVIAQCQPVAWIFGHDHFLRTETMCQYTKTRFISHPRGFPKALVPGFDPERVFDFP